MKHADGQSRCPQFPPQLQLCGVAFALDTTGNIKHRVSSDLCAILHSQSNRSDSRLRYYVFWFSCC